MPKHDYKTLDIEWKQDFLAGMKAAPLPDFHAILSREGQEGSRLVQILSPDLQMPAKKVQAMVAVLVPPLAV